MLPSLFYRLSVGGQLAGLSAPRLRKDPRMFVTARPVDYGAQAAALGRDTGEVLLTEQTPIPRLLRAADRIERHSGQAKAMAPHGIPMTGGQADQRLCTISTKHTYQP